MNSRAQALNAEEIQRLAVEANGRTSRLSGSTIEWPSAPLQWKLRFRNQKIDMMRNIKDPVTNYGLNGLNYLKTNPA